MPGIAAGVEITARAHVISDEVFRDLDDHSGNIALLLDDDSREAVGAQTPEEMLLLIDLLRSGPVSFDTDSKLLSTPARPVPQPSLVTP